MTIPLKNYSASGLTTPSGRAAHVTPADADLEDFTRALYVGTSGNLVVRMGVEQDIDITFIDVPAGSLLPIRVAQVRALTTAANIVALF